jgi:hypothetical protein
MAQILPFPLAKRAGLIRKQARFFLSQPHGPAEKNLAAQLDVQRQALHRRSVTPEVIEAEVAALEVAIRAEAWRQTLFGGAA